MNSTFSRFCIHRAESPIVAASGCPSTSFSPAPSAAVSRFRASKILRLGLMPYKVLASSYQHLMAEAPDTTGIGVRARKLDVTDGLEERSARARLSQTQCRVGWSPQISRTPLGFELSALFAFSDTTRSRMDGQTVMRAASSGPASLRLDSTKTLSGKPRGGSNTLGPDDCKAHGPWPGRKHRHLSY